MTKNTQDSFKERKRVSSACVACRGRKVKCNINDQFPCKSCTKMGLECVKSVVDRRRDRPESQYTQKLEHMLKLYEDENKRISLQLVNIAESMQDFSELHDSLQRKTNMTQTQNNDNIVLPEVETKVIDKDLSYRRNDTDILKAKYPMPPIFQASQDKPHSVYGPTSIFDNTRVHHKTLYDTNDTELEVDEIKNLATDPIIRECIKNFWVWQYPDVHLFLYKEAFLVDFFHAKKNSAYCCKSLIFAICAMGSLLSENSDIVKMSNHFYEQSKHLCMNRNNRPSISLLQSFMLLGMYDIYNGRNDSGWILTGMGMRIGFIIGFQLNPRDWLSDKELKLKNAFGNMIRSRIYWGTYLADHFIGLLLGRPASLKMNDTTIEETIELPDLDWIHEYCFQSKLYTEPKIEKLGDSLRCSAKLMEITENMLHDIFSNKKGMKKDQLQENIEKVHHYNLKIQEWREALPIEIKWSSNDLEELGNNLTKMTFKLMYYIVVLCLNRPFLGISGEYTEPLNRCNDAVNDLAILLKTFIINYNCRKSSTLMIFCSIISISVMMRVNSDVMSEVFRGKKTDRFKILLFMKILHETSKMWGLSSKAFKLLKKKFKQEYDVDIEDELRNFDLNQDIDFSIMNNMSFLDNGISINQFLEFDPLALDDAFSQPPMLFNTSVVDGSEGLLPYFNMSHFDYEI